MTEFQNQKSQRLEHVDLSRKGSVDEPILELVTFINSLANYFTTSSCSGRIIVFESAVEERDGHFQVTEGVPTTSSTTQMKIGKKGCKWLFVSHRAVLTDELSDSLNKVTSSNGNVVFKFEAMVMHIQCQTLEDAQKIHHAAMAAGFRNSGISIGGKKKIIVGVRSTHGLEAPLTKDGKMLVTPEYYEHLVECANSKMEENCIRINRFFENVKASLQNDSKPTGNRRKRENKKVGKCPGDGRKSGDGKNESALSSSECEEDITTGYKEDEMSLFMFQDT